MRASVSAQWRGENGGIPPTLFFFLTLLLSSFWTSRGHRCRPFSPPVLSPSVFIAHRVQQPHCSSIFHRMLLTHALALSASQFVHNKESPQIYMSMRSEGFDLTKLTYTRLEDNLICHRAIYVPLVIHFFVHIVNHNGSRPGA